MNDLERHMLEQRVTAALAKSGFTCRAYQQDRPAPGELERAGAQPKMSNAAIERQLAMVPGIFQDYGSALKALAHK